MIFITIFKIKVDSITPRVRPRQWKFLDTQLFNFFFSKTVRCCCTGVYFAGKPRKGGVEGCLFASFRISQQKYLRDVNYVRSCSTVEWFEIPWIFWRHHHHISVMGLGHFLTRSGLTYPEFFDTFTNIFLLRIFSTINHLFMKICLENWNDKFQENLSRPDIIDARARYRAAARRLRNTGLHLQWST